MRKAELERETEREGERKKRRDRKEQAEKNRGKASLHPLHPLPRVAAVTRAGSGYSQEPRIPSWSPTGVAGVQGLEPSPALLRSTLGVGWEMEQEGLELAPIGDNSVSGESLTCQPLIIEFSNIVWEIQNSIHEYPVWLIIRTTIIK